MTRTKLLTFLSALVCAVCLVFGIAACNAHEHTWSESWTADSDYHWHAPNCDDTDEVKDKAAHVDANQDGKCDVCKYDVGHEHTFADGWTSDETHHWHEATCSHTNEKGSYAEHEDLDEDGECDTCHKAVEHKHRYAKEWSTDKNNHWHDAICSHQTEKSEFGAHVDENQNGRCDVCDYEIGHEHSYEEKWTTSETQHWHAATCTHQNMKSELGDHDFDENGDCRTCHYHKHVFSEEWTVDQNKHWHVATCEDGGDEKSNEEAHDFGFSDKCKCGVEKIEINIYNMYYKPAQEFADEEVKDFGAWHAELVKAGVKHIELDVLTQDVIYTYDNPDGEDIKEVKYGTAKIVNVTIEKGELLEADERGLPDVTFKVIAKINGEPVANGKALGTGKINRVSGEGEITFTPYFGYSGTNHAGQKIEYAVTLTAEGDDNHSAIPSRCAITSKEEVTFTVEGDVHAETPTVNFKMESALSTGEEGRLNVTLGGLEDPSFSKSYYVNNVPAGWYILTFVPTESTSPEFGALVASVSGTPYAMYYGNGKAEFAAAVLVKEGIKTFKLDRTVPSAREGYLQLEPTSFDEIKIGAPGTSFMNYLPMSFEHGSTLSYLNTDPVYYTVPTSGDYEVTMFPYCCNNSSGGEPEYVYFYINGEENTNFLAGFNKHSVARVKLNEGDKINFVFKRKSDGSPYTATIGVKFSQMRVAELDKEVTTAIYITPADFAPATRNSEDSILFKPAKSGMYEINLKSTSSDLRYVTVGYGISSTDNLMGASTATRKEVSCQVYLNANETTYINFGLAGGIPVDFFCTIKEAQLEKLTLNEAATLTVNNFNPIIYRSFTAEKGGYYAFSATSTTTGSIERLTVGVNGSAENLLGSGTGKNRVGAFYAEQGETVSIALSRTSDSYAYTFDFKIFELAAEDFAKVELNKSTTLNEGLSEDSLYSLFTFNASEAGDYLLTLAYNSYISGIKVIRLQNKSVEKLITISDLFNDSTYSKNCEFTLEKDEKVDLLIWYTVTTRLSATTFSKIHLTVNHETPEAMVLAEDANIEFNDNQYTKTFVYTVEKAGDYMLTLSASTLNYITVTDGEGKSLFNGSTSNLKFKTTVISLEKDAKLILTFTYNYQKLSGSVALKATLNIIENEELTANQTAEVKFGDGVYGKIFSFTATDAAYYNLVLTSSTSLNGVMVIDADTKADIIPKISSSSRFNLLQYKLTAGQKINFMIIYDNSTTPPTVNFRVEYETPVAMTVNENATIQFGSENNAAYYTFTAADTGYYLLVITAETSSLNKVQVYNSETKYVYMDIGSSLKYTVKMPKFSANQKVSFMVMFNSNSSYPKVSFRVEYSAYEEMTVNEGKTIEFSKDNFAVYYSFTASEAGTYTRVLTSENELKGMQIIDGNTGSTIVPKIGSGFKYSISPFTMTAGQKILFVVYFNITAVTTFPTVEFRIERGNVTEMEVNKDTTVTFREGMNTVNLSFTATDASYYTFVLSAETKVQNVYVVNLTANNLGYGSINGTIFTYGKLNLKAGEKVNFLLYFTGAENYPTVNFRIEYDTPKALSANATEKITFGKTNNAAYYSFTASQDATYSLVLSSATSLKDISVMNLADGSDIIAKITTEDKVKVLLSSITTLKAEGKLSFLVLYNGGENYPVVDLTIGYNTPVEMTVNKETSVKFGQGKNVEYLSFTAAEEGQYALELSATSLQNVQLYNGETGASIINNITSADSLYILLSSATKFTAQQKLVFALVYNGDNYPTVKVKMVKEQPTPMNMGMNTVTFAAGTHIKSISYASRVGGSIAFNFSSESGMDNVKLYNGTTGNTINLSKGSTTQSIPADAPFVMIITYTGSAELKLNVNLLGLLDKPTGVKVEGFNYLTWERVANATKYKITWNDGHSQNSGETDKTYYIVPSFSGMVKKVTFTVVAVDETGSYGDSASTTAVSAWDFGDRYLNKLLTVTVTVPEGFPAETTTLKLQVAKNSDFASNSLMSCNLLEVTGKGEYTCALPTYGYSSNGNVCVRIDPKTLPDGYTCGVKTGVKGGTNTATLEITKAA